jgi:SAM-dependent methyltransferase
MTFRFADYRTILPFLRNRRRTFLDLVPEVAEGLDRDSSVLDVGCGDGRIASLLARRSKSQILAIDDSEAAVDATELTIAEAHQEKFVRIELASWADLTTCTFDTILAVHLLYHIDREQWLTFIDSMLARLNPGGKLVVVTTSKKSELHNIFASADVVRNMVKRQASLEDVYGDYIFGEDVTAALGAAFTIRSYRTRFPIKWPFKKPRENVEQRLDAHSAAWVKFFSFMYRLPTQTVITEFGGLLREKLVRANMKLTIEGGDVVHVITRP